MNLITVLITLLALSAATYLLSLVNSKLGAYFTIVTSLVTIVMLFLIIVSAILFFFQTKSITEWEEKIKG